MDKQKVDRVFNLMQNIACGSRFDIEDSYRQDLMSVIDLKKITFDEIGNMYYDGNFVNTLRNLDDLSMWKNQKVNKANVITELAAFYAQSLLTLFINKVIIIPDRELIICAAIELMEGRPNTPVISEAIVRPFKDKNDEELEKLPREIRKLIKFYYVPESTRRDAKTTT